MVDWKVEMSGKMMAERWDGSVVENSVWSSAALKVALTAALLAVSLAG